MGNAENPNQEQRRRSNYPSPEKAAFPEFLDPVEAEKGFGRLFNKVVKNVSERLTI